MGNNFHLTKRVVCNRGEEFVIIVPSVSFTGTMEEMIEGSVKEQDSNPKIFDVTDLPEGTYFRNAWTYDGEKVEVNFDKARTIQKGNLLVLIKNKLKLLNDRLDVANDSADTTKAQEIIEKKKILRDVTKLCDNPEITTLDSLKEVGIREIEEIV